MSNQKKRNELSLFYPTEKNFPGAGKCPFLGPFPDWCFLDACTLGACVTYRSFLWASGVDLDRRCFGSQYHGGLSVDSAFSVAEKKDGVLQAHLHFNHRAICRIDSGCCQRASQPRVLVIGNDDGNHYIG